MPYSVRMSRRGDPTLLACAVLAVGAVGVALVLQHAFDMRPCAWCTFQRLLFLLVAVLALAGWALGRVRGAAAACAALAGVVAVGGVWAALHQQFVAAQAQSCAFTLADRVLMHTRLDEFLPWLFEATASCSEANVALLGLPFALWSAALFAVLALLAGRAALRARLPAPAVRPAA